MIYITGDVHSKRMYNWEQKVHGPNVTTALEYLKILKKNKLKSTLFINGICLKEEKKAVRELLKYDVELGGHTFDNFGNKKVNKIKSYLYRKVFDCVYGPKFIQKRDIKKTEKAFRDFGLNMITWRTHAFASNNTTFHLLKQSGVKYVSDHLGEISPFEKNGIIHLPINIPSDQNTIAYGPTLRPENRDSFAGCTKGRISPDEWLDITKKRIIRNEKKGIPSILLLHPATMAYIENYGLFKKLAKFLSKYKSGMISEFKF